MRKTELFAWLAQRPLDLLATMLARGLNTPPTTSCGRLFDAVAGALDVARERQHYEGQAAIELETLAAQAGDIGDGYAFAVEEAADDPWRLDPGPMWEALLDDLVRGVDRATIAVRFHAGLAAAVAGLAVRLARAEGLSTVAVSGGVVQNRLLFEALARHLEAAGLTLYAHRQVPANDGGLALGQAVVAAARTIAMGQDAN